MRWRDWADATSAVGVIMAMLLLARGALAFTFPAALWLAGGELPLPHHALVWLRFVLPAAVVLFGLVGWWVVAAVVAWSAVAVEVVLDPSPVTLMLTVSVALALSVPGGFRRGRAALGSRTMWLIAAAAAIVALGAPGLQVALGHVTPRGATGSGFGFSFGIESRTNTAIKVGQLVVVALALVLAARALAPARRWRALTLVAVAVASAFVAVQLFADYGPYGPPHLAPRTALGLGATVAVLLAAILVPLVERRTRVPQGEG